MPRMRRVLALVFGSALALVPLLVAEHRLREHEGTLEFPADEPGRQFATRPGTRGTNSQGFHEREFALVPDPTHRRIAVLGDSLTWGTAGAEATYTRLAEPLIGEPWQVLNFSHYGYDIAQSLATLHARAWAYGPERVVYAAYVNDVIPTRLITVGEPPELAWVGFTGGIFPNGWTQRSAVLRRLQGRWLAEQVTDTPDYGFFREQLVAMAAEVRAHGATLLVLQLVPHVLAGDCEESRCTDALAVAHRQETIAREAGIPYASVLPWLRGSGASAFFPPGSEDWEHPSPEGHEVMARAFAAIFQRWEAGATLPGNDAPPEVP